MSDELQTSLLAWYRAEQRDLPFRRTRDPYAIWVSEIMAQQTRITALIPYFEVFIQKFPTVAALAAAEEHDVLKAWEGLGYYSRARNLHRAARKIMSEHGGQVPGRLNDIKDLPGIGDYTAGAILSIGFGQRVPAVDGNVLRVHARLVGDEQDVMRPEAKATAGTWVLSLMPVEAPGDMTQALMELGALVCLPKAPRCDKCPVEALCVARQTGCEQTLPVKTPKKAQRKMARPVYLIFDPARRVLMRQRTQSLLGGLWEFPEAPPDGLSLVSKAPCGQSIHVFTHIIWEMSGFLCQVDFTVEPADFFWIDADTFSTLPIPVAFRVFSDTVLGQFCR